MSGHTGHKSSAKQQARTEYKAYQHYRRHAHTHPDYKWASLPTFASAVQEQRNEDALHSVMDFAKKFIDTKLFNDRTLVWC